MRTRLPAYSWILAAAALMIGPSIAIASPPAPVNFAVRLSGSEEVPPRDTPGRGQAVFQVSQDGTEIRYFLVVANIDNVVASHIHSAPVGVNGPVVAFLAGPFASGGGPSKGILAEGVITATNLVGPLAGHPLGDLIAAMQSGDTYVNVHTNDGVAPTNTGPGDFPGGEIRGQI